MTTGERTVEHARVTSIRVLDLLGSEETEGVQAICKGSASEKASFAGPADGECAHNSAGSGSAQRPFLL